MLFGFVVDLTSLPKPLAATCPVLFLFLCAVAIGIAYSAKSKRECDRFPEARRPVFRSGLLVILLSLVALASILAPRHIPDRDSLRSQTGVFLGFESRRRAPTRIAIKVEGARQTYCIYQPFLKKLHGIKENTPVEFLLDRGCIAELLANGDEIVSFEEYVEDLSTTGMSFAVIPVLVALTHLVFARGPMRFLL